MILLDTNVISELMRPKPDPVVVSWFDRVGELPLYISTVSEGELWAGLNVMPSGKRRLTLETLVAEMLADDFAGRILSFDRQAARLFGDISGLRAKVGRPIGTADNQIAAIARAHGFKLATRNTKDFDHCDVDLINPWSFKGAVK
jgi:toxin FitB